MARDFSLISDKLNTYFKDNKICIGETIPVSGEYKSGDLMIKSNPIANESIGWICTQDGTPGEWIEINGDSNVDIDLSEYALKSEVEDIKSISNDNKSNIGILDNLQTETKTDLVSAINEIKNNVLDNNTLIEQLNSVLIEEYNEYIGM